jgi:uncharacterized protein (DUF427 family)
MTPASDQTMRIEPARSRWRAFFAGHVIADSADAVVLHEAGLPPVVYFPRGDVAMEYFSPTDRRTTSLHHGDASHFSLMMDGEWAENSAWAYEGSSELAGRIGFDASRIEVYEVDDARVNPHHEDRAVRDRSVNDVVQHTDSGGGASQRDHWSPNVAGPGPDGGVR